MLKNKYLQLLLLIALLIPLLDLLHPGFPLTHDGKDHLARIANFYQNLSEGNLIPRWAGFLNWGYGHPILMFLYPLPSFVISLLHELGLSFVNSTKLFFAISYIASGFTIYLFIKKLLNDEKAAVTAALLYTIAPYRFVDLYVRGALGEHTAFIFPPLIGYFLLSLKNKNSFWRFVGFTFSTAGLILSHNAISLMFLPIITLFVVYLIYHSKNKKILLIRILLGISLGFGLAAFFWIPAFLEGKYTLRDIVIGTEYKNSFVSLKNFFYGSWNYGGTRSFTTQLGISQWLIAFAGVFVLLTSRDKKYKKIILVLLVLLASSLFIMTGYSSFIWSNISLLPKFQFPWRFLTLSVFLSAILGGYLYKALPFNKVFMLVSVIALLFLTNFSYWKGQSYTSYSDKFFSNNYSGTTDTGESTPRWSVRFMEKDYKAPLEVLDGRADIKIIERHQTYHLYAIDAKKNSKLMENTLYFPGWKILDNNTAVQVEFQDRKHHGLMIFTLPKGLHKVEVVFQDTKVRLIADVISLISVILLVILGILKKANLWKRYQLF